MGENWHESTHCSLHLCCPSLLALFWFVTVFPFPLLHCLFWSAFGLFLVVYNCHPFHPLTILVIWHGCFPPKSRFYHIIDAAHKYIIDTWVGKYEEKRQVMILDGRRRGNQHAMHLSGVCMRLDNTLFIHSSFPLFLPSWCFYRTFIGPKKNMQLKTLKMC